MKAKRYKANPIIKPENIESYKDSYEVISVINAGVCKYNNNTLLLMRIAHRPCSCLFDQNTAAVTILDDIITFDKSNKSIDFSDERLVVTKDAAYLTSISYFAIAQSSDGLSFTLNSAPAIVPTEPYEAYGIEDPRITKLNDIYYIVYKGVSSAGILQCLASTKDFKSFRRHGIILPPENMDGVLFPQKINGKYIMMHRPYPALIGRPNIWLAYSDDLIHWGEHKLLDTCTGGRIGAGCVPVLTDEGWLVIYHTATENDVYTLDAMLLEKDMPERIIAKSKEPLLTPETSYEKYGFKNNIVFTCGCLRIKNTLRIYYGAADTSLAVADVEISLIMDNLY